jgi:hypothetical protein
MASKTLKTGPEPISLDAFGRDVLRRRENAASSEPPRNSGKRRSISKKLLLKAIEGTGARW